MFAVLSYVSTLFIWRVEVISDTSLNKNLVERNLASIGVKPGAFIPACDFWELSSEYLVTFDDCAWLSINMSGTVAEVELRERLSPSPETESEPCNIVAAEGGVIDRFVIGSGKGYVDQGTVVKKGDLLVSGVIEDKQGGYRLTGAEAEVYAEVERVITVEVPYAYTVREYTGEERVSRSLRFFGTGFDIPFGDGDPGEGWEVFYDTAAPVLPDGKTLPVAISTVTWRVFCDREYEYTPEEAAQIAGARLFRTMADELAGARILGVIRTVEQGETGVTATARVRCICDIAEKRRIITEVQTGD